MKKKLVSMGLLVGLLALAGCGPATTTSSVGGGNSSTSPDSTGGTTITEQDLERGITTYTDTDGEVKPLNRDTIYRNAGSPHVASYSEGMPEKQKLLVAPMRFEDYDGIVADDALLEKIRIAFDGTDEETAAVGGYISVSSFYEKSSYGKGAFDVVVLPCWIDYPGSPEEFRTAANAAGGGGIYASNYVRNWYRGEYAKDGHGQLGEDAHPWTYFDSDKDGYLDLIWNVYAYPQYGSGDNPDKNNDFWWAYVTYNLQTSPNVADPTVKTLAFASTNFMTQYNGYDSHTFIHETGHTLGLSDYYDYNNTWKPLGRVDYMDGNLGDHNAYSKFALGWVNPYILHEEDIDGVADEDGKGEGVTSATVTLRHGSSSGDALVLASPGYNGTAFDEYLILELMGPYGLCETDYKNGYDMSSGFKEPGIRVIHVDARAYANNWSTYIDDPDLVGQEATELRVGNTYGGRAGIGIDGDYWGHGTGTGPNKYSEYSYFTEASLVESTITDRNWMNTASYQATTASLFTRGARFVGGENSLWTKAFFPSKSNLWNKAKTITAGASTMQQTFTVDEEMDCNFSFRVNSIEEDPEYGVKATITVTLAD